VNLFSFKNEDLDLEKKMNINLKNATIFQVMDIALEGQEVDYDVYERQVILSKGEITVPWVNRIQQEKTVTGFVSDQQGNPLPGVTVVVKGTTTGTVTDAEGEFSLSIPAGVKVLQFSFVGMKTQEIPIAGRTAFTVVMEEEIIGIEEVVAIGYGTRERASITSAITSVSFEDIEDMGTNMRLDEALKGKAAGVLIRESSGQAGDAPYIRIRGTSTLTSGNDPLWVIDGVPTTDRSVISTMNISSVQSINVLKDAAASSIYGSRGANGVIIVTTKKGEKGKTKFNASLKTGLQKEEKRVDFLTGPEQIEYVKAARDNAYVDLGGSLDDPIDERTFELQYPPEWNEPGFVAPHYDVQDFVFQTGEILDFSVNASGGADFGTFYVSADYLNEEGIVRRTNYERASVRANATFDLTDYMSLNVSLNPSRSVTFMPGAWGKGSVLHNTITCPQMFPPTTGIPGYEPMPQYGRFRIQPLHTARLLYIDDELSQDQVMANGSLTIDILPELEYKIMGGYYYTVRDQETFSDLRITTIQNRLPYGSYGGNRRRKYVGDQTLTYEKIFNNVHNFSIMAGFSAEQYKYFSSSISGSNMPTDMVPTLNAAADINGSTGANEWSLMSYLGRVNYDYDKRYLLNLNIRRDGCSRFGKDRKWGVFPSVSVGWRIENEDFFHSELFSRLKLRASYGLMGNNQIGNYTHIATMGMAHYAIGTGESLNSGYYPSNLGNRELTWESMRSINLGVNIGLFDDRISLVVDAYRNVTSDLLMNVELPAHTGFGSQIMNIGEVMNEGIETQITTRNLVGDFKWTTNLSFSLNDNIVRHLGPEDAPILSGAWYGQSNYTMVGHHIGAFYLLDQIGVWNTQEEIDNNPHWEGSEPGDPRILDWNKDNVCDENDAHMMGRIQPVYTFSMGNTFRYKNFDLSLFLNAAGGNKIMNVLHNRGFGSSSENKAIHYGWWRDFWKSAEDPGNGMTPQPNANRTGAQAKWTDKALYDASYQRLKNVILGYTLPSTLTKNIGLSRVRIYLEGHNVWLHDNAPYVYNVEADLSEGQPISTTGSGYETASYPLPRQLLFGVDLSF